MFASYMILTEGSMYGFYKIISTKIFVFRFPLTGE